MKYEEKSIYYYNPVTGHWTIQSLEIQETKMKIAATPNIFSRWLHGKGALHYLQGICYYLLQGQMNGDSDL